MRVAVVVPTCRGFTVPETDMNVKWIAVHDSELRDVRGKRVDIVAPDPTFFGKKCDSIRSAGFLYALQNGYDYCLTLDDDCIPHFDWVSSHVDALQQEIHPWSWTVPGVRTRGIPYQTTPKKVAITHGLWSGVPDLDGITQKANPHLRLADIQGVWNSIAPPFSQSIMNLGFIREVGVVMYQPFQGEGTPFDRFADIWNGLIAQRCLTFHNYAFLNGGAIVHHTRASDVDANIIKEAPGMECHETFWRYVWAFENKGSNLSHTYAKLAWHIAEFEPPRKEWKPYFRNLKDNMLKWIEELQT